MKRTIIAGIVVVGLVTPGQANHIRGHYGGVPAVQPVVPPPRSVPWRGPTYVAPPPPYVPPPAPIYVPAPATPSQVDESPSIPARRRAPNVCTTGCD